MNIVPLTPEPNALPTGFDAFWAIYPRRIARKDARRAWDKIPATEHDAILTALIAWRRQWLKRGELEYVPHPATWLNGERWTDEIPDDVANPQQTSAAHVPFDPVKPAVKGEMSEAVRAELRRILKR